MLFSPLLGMEGVVTRSAQEKLFILGSCCQSAYSLFFKIMSILVIQYFGQLPSHANLWISERWERTIKFQSMISYYSLLCNLQKRGNELNVEIIHIESLLYFNTISLRTVAANSQSKGAQFNNLIYSIFMINLKNHGQFVMCVHFVIWWKARALDQTKYAHNICVEEVYHCLFLYILPS